MTGTPEGPEHLTCSFCGKPQRQVRKLIAGPGVYICDECIELCNEIVDEELEEERRTRACAPASCPRRARSTTSLDDYVVGQDQREEGPLGRGLQPLQAHPRAAPSETDDEVELAKSNILLLGPTGCGKTLLAQTLARILKVPFAIADATSLTEAGYVGEDVENILLKIITAADFDVTRAEVGIIYIDEIDKVARKAENLSITRDVSGRGRAAGAAQDPRGHRGARAAAGRAQAPAAGAHQDRHHEHPVHPRRRVRRAREDRRRPRRQEGRRLRRRPHRRNEARDRRPARRRCCPRTCTSSA